jgi:hypothetical protein
MPLWITAKESPEPIFLKTQVIQNQEWYSLQASLWKQQAMHSSNASDWLNYYLASRFSNASPSVLEAVADEMQSRMPDAAEVKFVKSWNLGFTAQSYKLILEAHRDAPDRTVLFPWLIMQHDYNGNLVERKATCKEMYESGSVSTSLLNYSYNVLMSLEKEAVLITDSDNTTVPLFILQDVLHLRPDVAILNLDMLLHPSYRNSRLSAYNIVLPADGHALNKPMLCSLLPESNPAKSFYYALTLAKENIASIKNQLYVVGLASQISSTRIDNISIIKENLESKFLLDYLTVDFNGENNLAAGRVLSANYLVPMLLLDEHYRTTGAREKAQQLEALIRKLAEENGKTLLVDNFLNRNSQEAKPFIAFKLDLKTLEGEYKHVKDKVYANMYEVSNKEYNAFLHHLQQNKLNELYERCKIQLDNYEEPALSFMRSYHTTPPNKKNKYFSEYPVVNISFDAAKAYCEWLTEQYNNTPDRKFRRVRFRLPSVQEWQLAAVGVKDPVSWSMSENKAEIRKYEEGKELGKKYESMMVSLDNPQVLYPWFRVYSLRNKVLNFKGCSLGNFKFPADQKPCLPEKMATVDGFFMMSSVGAYFPNGIGLYDVVGNVSEMTNEEGKACGGSWNHSPEESTMKSINAYSRPGAETGFRIFMEVLEQ